MRNLSILWEDIRNQIRMAYVIRCLIICLYISYLTLTISSPIAFLERCWAQYIFLTFLSIWVIFLINSKLLCNILSRYVMLSESRIYKIYLKYKIQLILPGVAVYVFFLPLKLVALHLSSVFFKYGNIPRDAPNMLSNVPQCSPYVIQPRSQIYHLHMLCSSKRKSG